MSKQIHDYTAAVSIDASADYLLIDPASSGIYKKINRNVLLGLASAPLGLTDSQSPTNKIFDNTNSITVKDGSLTIQNSSSTTKQAVFSAASITAGQTRTFTFPDASGTLTTTAGTQTLTNKTLTSPTITGGTIDNSTVTVDSISGHTSATIVTVANLQISNGVLNTANAVTATAMADGAIQPKALLTGTGSGWAWSTWSPSYANLTVGNGTVVAKYIQTGKAVLVRYSIAFGSTSVMGTNPTISVPVAAASGQTSSGEGNRLGSCKLLNSGVQNYVGIVEFDGTAANFAPYANDASGTYLTKTGVTATVPFTWGNGSSLSFTVVYEAA